MARPGERHLLRPLALGLAARRPRVHPPRPVPVVAVAHAERERRPERTPVAQAGEHLHLVGLDLLSRRAAVTLLAAAEIGVDRLPVEHEAGRQTRENRDESRTVRLARGGQLEIHSVGLISGKPSALRMTGTGAATPVHSSNDAAPCATSTSSPSSTPAPARAAASPVTGRGSGRPTSVCPAASP